MNIEGTRARRRPRQRCMEGVKRGFEDLREKGLGDDEYVKKAELKCLRNADPSYERDNNRVKVKKCLIS